MQNSLRYNGTGTLDTTITVNRIATQGANGEAGAEGRSRMCGSRAGYKGRDPSRIPARRRRLLDQHSRRSARGTLARGMEARAVSAAVSKERSAYGAVKRSEPTPRRASADDVISIPQERGQAGTACAPVG